MNATKIEWTDRTWNPLTGCTKVSPGCDHCYAKTMHERFNGPGSFDTVTLHPERLDQPLRWRAPRRVFVNSMSDLFHTDVPVGYIAEVFAVMALAPQHTFQVLTKRHARMRSHVSSETFIGLVYDYAERRAGNHLDRSVWPLPNVWLGVSVENQQWADIRIPALLDTPAAVRFLSCEPLLGPVDLVGVLEDGCQACGPAITHEGSAMRTDYGTGIEYDCHHEIGIDWVIVGGESGHGARPMHLDWARSLRDQCVASDVPFLFKQWGEWAPTNVLSVGHLSDPRERHGEIVDDALHPSVTWRRVYRRVGKKAAGRELDGRTWDQYPGVSLVVGCDARGDG